MADKKTFVVVRPDGGKHAVRAEAIGLGDGIVMLTADAGNETLAVLSLHGISFVAEATSMPELAVPAKAEHPSSAGEA